MAANELPNIDALREALNTLDQRYKATYVTPEAMNALKKTFQTFNITIKDWNTIISYIMTVGSTLEALYQVMPELESATINTYKDAVNGSFTITDVVVNIQD